MRLAAFLLALPLFAAAPVVSPTAINHTDIRGRVAYGLLVSPITATVTATGSWSMASANDTAGHYVTVLKVSGTGTCTDADGAVSATCSGMSGNAVLRLGWLSWWTNLNVPGTYTTNLTFTAGADTTVVPITVAVVAPEPRAFSEIAAPSGCANSNALYAPVKDTCTVTSERPPSTAFSLPSVGTPYTDAQFGGTVTPITAARYFHDYSSRTPFNSDGTRLVVTAYPVGGSVAPEVINATTGANVASSIPGTDTWRIWSATTVDKYYYVSGTQLRQYTVGGANSLVRDFAADGLTALSNGGQADASKDDWVAFYDDSGGVKKVCAYNIPGNALACASYGALSPAVTVNYVLLSKGADVVSGCRYVILADASTLGGSPIYCVVGGTMTLVTRGPNYPGHTALYDFDPSTACAPALGRCVAAGHDDTVEQGGIQYLVTGEYFENAPAMYAIVALRLNAGTAMTTPVELGGGLRIIYAYQHGSGISYLTQHHVGCARSAPYCAISTGILSDSSGVQGSVTGYEITNVTASSTNAVITIGTHPFQIGDVVNIGGVGGPTIVNVPCTVTAIAATTLTCAIDLAGQPAYTAATGALHANVGTATLPARKAFGGELIVFRPDGFLRRVAENRSIPSTKERDSTAVGYYSISRAAISHDGSRIAGDSNYGNPTQFRVALADTGVTGTAFGLTRATGIRATEYLIHYRAPDAATCTQVVSVNADLTSPVLNTTDAGGFRDRYAHATSLTANTRYYFTLCGARIQGTFTTRAAETPATSTLAVRGFAPANLTITNMRVTWGYTSSMSETPVDISCTSGTECGGTIPAQSKRVVWVARVYRNISTAVTPTGAAVAVSVD